MKISKAFRLPSGIIVPAGTELHFSTEGKGFYLGETVEAQKIPLSAIEMASVEMAARGKKSQGTLHGSIVYDPMTIKFKGDFKPEEYHNAIIVGDKIYVYLWDTREIVFEDLVANVDLEKAKIALDNLTPVKGDQDFVKAVAAQKAEISRKQSQAKANLLRNLNGFVEGFQRGTYVQTLHDPVQTHAVYGLSASGRDVEDLKKALKDSFKATHFRVVKNNHGFAILCFKVKV